MVDHMGPGNRDWEAVRCGPEAGDWPRRVHDAVAAARDHAGADGDRGPDAADLSGGETDAAAAAREPLRKRPGELWPELKPLGLQAGSQPFTAGEVGELLGVKASRLGQSGPPMRDMRLERNRDYPCDSDLCFERGQYLDRIRLTGADLHALRALLLAQDDLAMLRDTAAMLVATLTGEDLIAAIAGLVTTAHADGYKLADEDHRLTYQDAAGVREFLQGKLEAGPAPGEDWAWGSDATAIRRVIALLEDK